MKKIIALVLAAMMAMALMAGCGAQEAPATEAPAAEAPAAEAPAAAEELSGTVNVNGSTSMGDVIAALTEGFNEIHGQVQINYTGSGSGAGIEGALAGTCDLGLSSRALSDDEKGQGAVENIVAKDGVAVVVNPENPVTDLTTDEIAAIYTGEIDNWSQLGGPDAQIAVLGRDSASGTRAAFEEILDIEDACVYLNEYSSTGDVIGNVASNPNAIGYASLSAVDETVVAVAVNGVAPTEETVADGSFAIQRPFVIVTVEGKELSPAAQAFLDYAMSPEVAEIIAAAGAVSANG